MSQSDLVGLVALVILIASTVAVSVLDEVSDRRRRARRLRAK